MTRSTEAHDNREQLLAIERELRANRIALDGLAQAYDVFRFTGGVVAPGPWSLAALNCYLSGPFAADRTWTARAERYRCLTEAIVAMGPAASAGTGPKSLRARAEIANRFELESVEIRALGSALQTAVAGFVEETD